jgi:hypothetical protein
VQSTRYPQLPNQKTASICTIQATIKTALKPKLYLIDSQLYYGVYSESFSRSGATGDYSINEGAPSESSTEQSETTMTKTTILPSANVYNSAGDKIEPVLTINSSHPGFALTKLDKDSTCTFELQIKYEGKDIVNYDLFIAFEPSEVPPP